MEEARRNKMLNYIYYALGFDKVCSFMAYIVQARKDSNALVEQLYYQLRGLE